MAQTSGFYPTFKVKICFDCKMFDVAIGLLASTEKMVPEGHLHMRPFQFHLKEHWRYPQMLDSLLPWSKTISAHLEWCQKPVNMMKGVDLHPKTTVFSSLQMPQTKVGPLTESKRSVVRQGKKAIHECPQVAGGISGPGGSRTSAKTKQCWLLWTTQQ